MNRALAVVASFVAFSAAILPTAAMAFEDGDGESDAIEGQGYGVLLGDGEIRTQIFAEGAALHRVRRQASGPCKYPERWIADFEAYGELSDYYPMLYDLYTEADGWDTDRFSNDEDQFEVFEVGGADACVQWVYQSFDSCTDEDRIGVAAYYMRMDTRRLGTDEPHIVGNTLDWGLHNGLDDYCLEMTTFEAWRLMIEDSDALPIPIRATFPQYRTLVGLENSVWYEVEGDEDPYLDSFVTALPTPGGLVWTIDIDTWLEEIAIDVDGDGAWDHTVTCSTGDRESLTECAGSLEEPLYEFMYEERAFHPFTIETRWRGIGIDPGGVAHDLEPEFLTRQYTFDWETVEVRSSLDG